MKKYAIFQGQTKSLFWWNFFRFFSLLCVTTIEPKRSSYWILKDPIFDKEKKGFVYARRY